MYLARIFNRLMDIYIKIYLFKQGPIVVVI